MAITNAYFCNILGPGNYKWQILVMPEHLSNS